MGKRRRLRPQFLGQPFGSTRRALRTKLGDLASRYKHPVDDATHANNICEVADAMTAEFASCLRGGRFRIGIAQKCLNLYLKYLWCVGEILTPPHCPFDATMIARLTLSTIGPTFGPLPCGRPQQLHLLIDLLTIDG